MKNQKIAFITGCNGELGIQIAKRLISKKFKLICHLRKKNQEFSKLLKKNKKSIIKILYFDLLETKKIELELKKIYLKTDKLDLIILNAGVPHGGLIELTKVDEIRKIFEVNYFSQVFIIQKLLRLLKKTKNSSIINISSLSSLIPLRGNIAYGGSKASINFCTKILAKELKIYGIKVNAIAPTVLNNKMGKKTDINTAKFLLKSSLKNKKIDMKFVVNKILYLLSKKGNSINGKIIKVL
tara:strand:- start:362 stop:1081 length:720 start_codon:yes stop_codon:yes gene_type:complete